MPKETAKPAAPNGWIKLLESTGTIPVSDNSYFNGSEISDSIDWRDKYYVAPVMNQGACGADWAIAAIGAVEGAYAVQNDYRLDFYNQYWLSVQQLLDCTGESDNCEGGNMNDAFYYLQSNYSMYAMPNNGPAGGYIYH